MQLLIDKIKGAHAATLSAYVDTYKATESDRKAKIVAISELAAYVNAHYLASDLVCISCASAEKLMQLAVSYFEQLAVAGAKKKKRSIEKDSASEGSEPT
jgi:hypothetical protein